MARIPLLLTLLALLLTTGAAPASAAGSWSWPVRGDVITAYRNGPDPYARGQHRGIDIAAPVGRAVSAPVPGRVTFAGTVGSSGLTVALRTADGRWDTSYLHLSSVVVHKGDSVRAGARLGAVGTTGRRSAAQPHLHFGVREAGSRHAYHDPMSFLAPLGGPGQREPGPAGAPLPLPLKAGPGAAPAPAPAPAGRRSPAPAPGRTRAPAGAPGHAPAPAPARAGSAVARALAPPDLGPAPAAAGRRGTVHRGERAGSASQGPERAPAAHPRAAKVPAAAPAGSVHVPPEAGRGFDLGWALACLAVVAAALALGKPGGERSPRGRPGAAPLRVFGGWPTTSRPRSTT
jgi:hypothetical protein